MKGYQALVGVDVSKGGMFAYFLKEQKAKEWISKTKSLLIGSLKQIENKIEIVELHKCFNPDCEELAEADMPYCLGCDNIIADSFAEKYSETIEV